MSSFLHSAAWERFQRRVGNSPVRHEGQVYTQTTSAGFRYGTGSRLSFGPESTLPTLIAPHFLRIEPIDEASLARIRDLAGKRLRPTTSVQPRQSIVLDLTHTENDLLANMHQKHRYNIRLANRHGVDVEIFSTRLTEQFERFWALLEDTAKRQGFRTHPKSYYASQVEELEKDGEAHLLFARGNNCDLATMLLITHGSTATYLHGASSTEYRELMAPYALHWEAIRFVKSLGYTLYDFWGLHAVYNSETGEWEPQANHPSHGVTRLKLGFNGTVINYPGTFDLILQPIWYSAYTALRAARARKRAFS